MPAHSVKFDEQDHEKIKGDDALSGSYEESALSTILKKKQLLKQSRCRGEGREGGEREKGVKIDQEGDMNICMEFLLCTCLPTEAVL